MLWQPVATATAAQSVAKRKIRLLMLPQTCSLTAFSGQAGLGTNLQIVVLEGLRTGMSQFDGVKGCAEYLLNAPFVK
jgi:hypothetical protein